VIDQWYGKDGQPADLPPADPQEQSGDLERDLPMGEPGAVGDD